LERYTFQWEKAECLDGFAATSIGFGVFKGA
jgi:hypothetical protein